MNTPTAPAISKADLAAKLADVDFRKYDEILKGIAKFTKEKKLSSGSMTFEQFRLKIAQNLLKPSCKSVLEKVLAL